LSVSRLVLAVLDEKVFESVGRSCSCRRILPPSSRIVVERCQLV
uniref:C-CAP/cofactor C-like domain-containing protein n=1 Tax=Haemonchus placei TaxID=6290 RepID=A0A0N4XAY4_HAEPC